MIDFHSHILPYIDDGAKNFDMSLDMLRFSSDQGVKHICATSHYIPEDLELSLKDYIVKLNNVRHLCKLKDIEINIIPALEVYISPELPRLYKEKKIWGINDTQYLLIELPMQQFPMYTEEVFYELRIMGAVPMLAHPERNLRIMKEVSLLENLIDQGNLAQINAGSLRGIYGKDIKEFAEKLVSRRLIHMLGSDAHDDKRRTTKIDDAYEFIKNKDKELYSWMIENQYNIIEGKAVEPLPIKSNKKRFGFFD